MFICENIVLNSLKSIMNSDLSLVKLFLILLSHSISILSAKFLYWLPDVLSHSGFQLAVFLKTLSFTMTSLCDLCSFLQVSSAIFRECYSLKGEAMTNYFYVPVLTKLSLCSSPINAKQ